MTAIAAKLLFSLISTIAAESAAEYHTDIDPTAWAVQSVGPCTDAQDPEMDPSNPTLCVVAQHPEIGQFTAIAGQDLAVFAVYQGGELFASVAEPVQLSAQWNRADYCAGMLADDEIALTSVCR